MAETRQPVLTLEEVTAYVEEIFPQQSGVFLIEEIASMRARVRMPVQDRHLRPGRTISGPAMFTAADCSFWFALLAMIGRQGMSVTSNMSINFLRRPPAADVIAEARILKLGRTLAVGDITVFSEGDDRPVAHATTTYAIPPKK